MDDLMAERGRRTTGQHPYIQSYTYLMSTSSQSPRPIMSVFMDDTLCPWQGTGDEIVDRLDALLPYSPYAPEASSCLGMSHPSFITISHHIATQYAIPPHLTSSHYKHKVQSRHVFSRLPHHIKMHTATPPRDYMTRLAGEVIAAAACRAVGWTIAHRLLRSTIAPQVSLRLPSCIHLSIYVTYHDDHPLLHCCIIGVKDAALTPP